MVRRLLFLLMLRCGFCISYVLYFYYHYFYLFLVKRFFLHIARSTFVGVLIGLLWGQSRMIYIWINNIYTCHVADIYKSPCKYTVCVFVCFFSLLSDTLSLVMVVVYNYCAKVNINHKHSSFTVCISFDSLY